MNKKITLFRCLSLVFAAVAIVLEILPKSAAVLSLANEGKDLVVTYYSAFDVTPLTKGNFAPFVAAIMSVFVAALALVTIFVKKRNFKLDCVFVAFTILTVVVSVFPIFQGVECYTVMGIFVTLCLVASTIAYAFSIYSQE